ncbi:hypothetical protein QL285_041771 [Trifolium repens]|nr:hypothetical protein QL285_041771 [Trifolium repens]
MEVELEPRVKPLQFKVKAMSRESPSQKAINVLDSDLRSHWSTATNTKEWILLQLNEPCLLSHIRIYNKSVLEWEIAVGLRYKPETFQKVRPRCEAPRRDMIYPTNYTPCQYVRISCLRGNPIAIFFVQLIGVPVVGLEAEFQPVVNYLLPHILSHKQDPHDTHLQLLQDLTNRLLVFLPQLETDLASFPDNPESNLRFLAMLAGPYYPILHVANARTTSKHPGNITDSEVYRSNQLSPALTVSSNFEPRRSRSASSFNLSAYRSMVLRPDRIFMLLRKAYKDSDLGSVCRMASRILQKIIDPDPEQDVSYPQNEVIAPLEEKSKLELPSPCTFVDYSNLFGEEFKMQDEHWDCSYLNVLDIGAVEEGILHVLYSCAAQPVLCSKMAERISEFWAALPLVQALLPALRPWLSNSFDVVDDSFSQWNQPIVQQALSQIVATATSASYRSLLHACSGYLSSYSPSHARAACVLIDLCSGVLAPWITQVIAKVDLALELLEDLLGIIQDAHNSLIRARAALKYIVLALSGHVDDILGKYKEVKLRILFLVEMLEPFLDPAIAVSKSKIAFGDLSSSFPEQQEHNCMISLNIIRAAVQKAAVLPSLESEWRHGSVAPSVLLSILEPHMLLPPDVDLCKSVLRPTGHETASVSPLSSGVNGGSSFSKFNSQDESDGKTEVPETAGRSDFVEDRNLLFAPPELQGISLRNSCNVPNHNSSVSHAGDMRLESQHVVDKHSTHRFLSDVVIDSGLGFEYFNLQADYFQLLNYHDCELRASEFRRLALDLHSQNDVTVETHDAAIDAFLLAAECHVNPYFMLTIGAASKLTDLLNIKAGKTVHSHTNVNAKGAFGKNKPNLETIAHIERKRDKLVFHILLEAAELDRKYHLRVSDGEGGPYCAEGFDEQVIKMSSHDEQHADALTLVRQNQALLCNFLIQRLQRDQISMHEILLQSLVYFLHTGTKLFCPPESVIDIILKYAEDLNKMLASFHHETKEGNLHLAQERTHGVERRWLLLQQLVIASSNGGEEEKFGTSIQNSYLCGNLIPPSAWMQRISHFSCSVYPLVRFLGWMAVSRNAKQYMKDQSFLASNLSQLTYLLSIFADDLAAVDNVINKKYEEVKIEDSRVEHSSSTKKEFERGNQYHEEQSFSAVYPELWKFFPNMKGKFESFGEAILEAVGLQLRSVSSTLVPDVLCWLSELISWPFSFTSSIGGDNLKGYNAKNARTIILYILEAIIAEHMEAMVPETPKLVHVLLSLSCSSYCDVPFLESVLCLLKPIISYSLSKVSRDERLLEADSCLNFEELCFNVLLSKIKHKDDIKLPEDKEYNVALGIFILASIFPDLSIQYRRDFLQSLLSLVNFADSEPTTSLYDYLSAFQCVMDNCKLLLVNALTASGVIPLQLPPFPRVSVGGLSDDNLPNPWFLSDICRHSFENDVHNVEHNNSAADDDHCHLPSEDLEGFSKDIEVLISELTPAIERCWNLYHQISRKLTISSAECFVFSKCLTSISRKFHKCEDDDQNSSLAKSSDLFSRHWRIGVLGLSELITVLQESSCWEVSCMMLDCLLGIPYSFSLDNVVGIICTAIKKVACNAPKISWRLRSNKWLSYLTARGIYNTRESEIPLTDLFCTFLGHAEPEQRIIAVKHLGRLLGQSMNGERELINSRICTDFVPNKLVLSIPDYVLSQLVSNTWDEVVVLASSDTSSQIRVHAMALLSNYIPFAERHHIQSLLVAADSICCLRNAQPSHDGSILQLSLALIAYACLCSPPEDISLIPQNVWENVETLASTKYDGKLGDLEKRTCQVLCRLKDGNETKEALKEVLSSNSSKQHDPDFASTRESVLQVLGNLKAVHSYFDVFSTKINQDDMELEEAELELDIIQKERALPGQVEDSKNRNQITSSPSSGKDVSRLQQIRECIRTLEKSKLKEDILARRQKKLLIRHDRQKYLEEAALREAEILQELDRERVAEMEKEMERQKLLEIERAKTRELRHNLDMEKERQTQRELQREIEQAESGIRPSRRDFPSSTHNSRPRDRFRERDNGRSGNEGSTRVGPGSLQSEIPSTNSSMTASPTIVLSGSRTFSGQMPTILQSRDRQDDCGSIYEENVDGSKDSGDTGSIGDPELASAFDGQSGGYGSQRHSSRGSKSRQLGERRDSRENRREGKWERKH